MNNNHNTNTWKFPVLISYASIFNPKEYSVMQKMGTVFGEIVVWDSFNMAYRDEGSFSDQK